MPSPRQGRAFIFAALISFLILWYCYGSTSRFLGADFSNIAPPQSRVTDVESKSPVLESILVTSLGNLYIEPTGPVHSAQDSHRQVTTSTSVVKPIQTIGITTSNPDLTVSPSDVLLIFKTGASTIWRRMPLHLTTTLLNNRVPNSVIYSELSEKLASNIKSIDVLANVSDLIRDVDPAAYENYLEFQSTTHTNTYREHAQLPGDEPRAKPGNTPGWLLDRYKFLPMLNHAYQTWPGLKYYVYIEDDTFIFWDNILQWLSALSPDQEPFYFGARSGEGNETFAQGGSGIVFSGSLMRTVFGNEDPPTLAKYGNYTSTSCCGDVAFGQILRDHGIFVNKGDLNPVSFRPEPPWKTGFDEGVWCFPVFTFHHLHQRDLVQLAEVEQTLKKGSTPSRPVIFRDIFTNLILPHLSNDTRSNWDNFASRYTLTVNSTSGFHPTFRPENSTAFNLAYKSPESCRAACLSFDDCYSWRHESGMAICVLDSAIKLGREVDPLADWEPKTEVVSGWMLGRMESRLMAEMCNTIREP